MKLWWRRNEAESQVRKVIAGNLEAKIFGTGLDRSRGERGQFFVTITVADAEARDAASEFLGQRFNSEEVDFSHGWSRFALGDWMIRIYPSVA